MRKDSVFKRRIAFLELLGLGILYIVIMWILLPQAFASPIAVVTILILEFLAAIYYLYISPYLIHHDSLFKRGLGLKETLYIRTDNFQLAWKQIYVPLVIFAFIIITVSWLDQRPFFITFDWYTLGVKFMAYVLSAMAQELIFFSFIFIRLKELVITSSKERSRFVVVGIFTLIFMFFHFPNILLMLLSVPFAFFMGYLFYSYPNIYVIVIVHAVLGTLLHRVYELHMKIGPFYGTETSYIKGLLVPMLNDILSQLW